MNFPPRLPGALTFAILFAASIASAEAPVKKPPPKVLMIGDSLSVGPFGEYVAQYLIVRCGRNNFEQFASCGSSPENWLKSEPDYFTKCGFRENSPERQTVIDYQNGKRPPPIKTPKLEELIARYRPTTVVVQLGTNWMDPLKANKPGAEDKFSEILDRFAIALHTYTVRQVIWITPPDASAYSSEVKRIVDALIRNAAKKYNYQMVISGALTHYVRGRSGGDGVHYNKDGAKLWADEATKELDRKLR